MLRKDLVYHFVASAILSAIFGFEIALTTGILKELLWDRYMEQGTEDINDIYADVLGCWVGVLV